MTDLSVIQLTEDQINSIKYMICVAPQGSLLMKQIMYALLDSSDGCTRSVHHTLREGNEYKSVEINHHFLTAAGMTSSNCGTHINELMRVAGTSYRFSVHYGAYKHGRFDSDGIFPGYKGQPIDAPMRYTMWLAPKPYGHVKRSKGVRISRKKLEAIEVSKHSLYKNSEGMTYHFGEQRHQVPRHLLTEEGQLSELREQRRLLTERLREVEGCLSERDRADRALRSALGLVELT